MLSYQESEAEGGREGGGRGEEGGGKTSWRPGTDGEPEGR